MGDLTEAEDDAGGEPIGGDVACASDYMGDVNWAVVDVRVVKVGLDGADRDAVVEDGKNVVDAESAGDSPAPLAGLEDGSADLGASAQYVNKGNPPIGLVTEDWSRLTGEDTVVGAGGEQAAFGLHSEVAIEIGRGAEYGAGVDGLIVGAEDTAVYWVNVAISGVEIET